jgi:hypothetical protein
MKIEELRIGNYLGYQIGHSIHQGVVTTISKNKITIDHKYFKITSEYISPIPITAGSLEKFGKSISNRYSYRDGYYYFSPLYLSDEFKLCIEDYHGNCMFETGLTIKYIHQLQNLFYDITKINYDTQRTIKK